MLIAVIKGTRTIALVIASLVLGTTAIDAQAGETIIGIYDCGQWFKDSAARPWLLGFLSGLNAAAPGDSLGRLGSAEQTYLWMNKYCKANPLKTVSDGGIDLFIELGQVKKP